MKNGATTEYDGIEKITDQHFRDFQLEKEINDLFKYIEKKYFKGRDYCDSKMNDWGDAFINEFETFCQTKKEYKFFLFLRLIPNTIQNSFGRQGCVVKSKFGIMELEKKFPTFRLTLKVIYVKIEQLKPIINDNIPIEDDIRKIIANIIDERKYINEDINDYIEYIRKDVFNILRKIYPMKCFNFFFNLSKFPQIINVSSKIVNCIKGDYLIGLNHHSTDIACNIHCFIYTLKY